MRNRAARESDECKATISAGRADLRDLRPPRALTSCARRREGTTSNLSARAPPPNAAIARERAARTLATVWTLCSAPPSMEDGACPSAAIARARGGT